MGASEAGDADEIEFEETVAALRSSPNRTVFTESSNADGWISTDLTVDIER